MICLKACQKELIHRYSGSTDQVGRRVHRVGHPLPRAAHGPQRRGLRVRRGRLLRRGLHLLGAEGGDAGRGSGGGNSGTKRGITDIWAGMLEILVRLSLQLK